MGDEARQGVNTEAQGIDLALQGADALLQVLVALLELGHQVVHDVLGLWDKKGQR